MTQSFSKEEIYGLINQMRRAVVRGSKAEFEKFLPTAQGSGADLEIQAIIAGRLGFPVDTELFLSEPDEISRRIAG